MRNKLLISILIACIAAGAAGCGPSKDELRARERARLEREEQARREAQRANKAITEMNQKLGRKPPTLDLGLPPGSPPQPKPDQPKQP